MDSVVGNVIENCKISHFTEPISVGWPIYIEEGEGEGEGEWEGKGKWVCNRAHFAFVMFNGTFFVSCYDTNTPGSRAGCSPLQY